MKEDWYWEWGVCGVVWCGEEGDIIERNGARE